MERDGFDLTGQVIDGRYRVEFELGRGGMGRVWSVQHVESRGHLALKTLEVRLGGETDARDRLLREARAASALRTRHVARVLDARSDYVHQGRALPYLVMERLEGLTLEQWLARRGAMTPAEVLWVVEQVGRAVHLAHEQGIVHRDLKPSNVFVSVDEEGAPVVKLCDFGIAKFTSLAAAALLTEAGGATSAKDVLGTPLYLAPELLRGAVLATPATDQWALAMTVFKALSGREYFSSAKTGPELVLKIAQDPLIPPTSLVAGLPEAFDAWFMKTCARDPAERFENVEAQLAALAKALGEPVPKAPPITRADVAAATRNTGTESPAFARRYRRTNARKLSLFLALTWAAVGTGWLLFADARPGAAASSAESTLLARSPRQRLVLGDAARSAAPSELSPTAPNAVTAPSDTPRSKKPPPTTERRAVTRAAGEACRRSRECESGLCVGERCR